MSRHIRGILGAAVVAFAATVAVAGPAVAADDEQITTYRIAYTVRADGTVGVVEEFTYDFGTAERHGPERFIDTREPANKRDDRLYRVENVSATSSTGAPDDVSVEEVDNQTRIRVGDPDVRVSGPHTYRLSYAIVGALNAQPNDTGELYWDAAGPDWRVPIDDLSVSIEAPGGITRQRCLFGVPGSTGSCTGSNLQAGKAVFTQDRVAPGEVLTVVGAFSLSGMTIPPPTLEDRSPLARAFKATPVSVGGGAGLLVLGGVPLALAVRRRRDRRYVDAIPGLAPAPGQQVREEPVSLLEPDGTVVQFAPPKDVSPAEAGILLDRRVKTTSTTATLLDLAARGFLHIAETRVSPKRQQPNQWSLAAVRGPDPSLRPHEHDLLATLFGNMQAVTLSKGGRSKVFLRTHQAVAKSLAARVVERRWFPAMSAGTLDAGSVIGAIFAGIAVFGGLLVGLAFLSLGGLGFLAAGLLLALVCVIVALFVRRGRTAAGEAVAQQVRGFKHYLEVAEAERLRFEEGEDIFSRYLPWAVAFGIAKEWAKVCHELAQAGRIPASPTWYDSTRPWSYNDFNTNVGGMSGAWASAATPVSTGSGSSSSGSSGFSSSSSSGGGGGGGGGGSW